MSRISDACYKRLTGAGLSFDDAKVLRSIAMTLHRWHEKERGSEHGGIERDEVTGKVSWVCTRTGARTPARDMETMALKRLGAVMERNPAYRHYVQTDPRGPALYIVPPETLEFFAGARIAAIYHYGIGVY